MPIIIPENLPAAEVLRREYIPVMHEVRARTQDIRPLRIALFNLMPTKIATEIQFLRLLGNTPLQVEIDLIMPGGHVSKNTPREHLLAFYQPFDQIRKKRYDGAIITGAPVEMLDFDAVDYWDELTGILDFCQTNVYSTIFICWAAQAALYHYYGIEKVELKEKLFGIYLHDLVHNRDITRGFNDVFYAPHSRHTANRPEDIEATPDLRVLAKSDAAGVLLSTTVDQRHYFISGHLEYDRDTLAKEYERDVSRGLSNVQFPFHYFPDDDPSKVPPMRWHGHANLLYSNWLNHVVYQETPYDLSTLKPRKPVN